LALALGGLRAERGQEAPGGPMRRPLRTPSLALLLLGLPAVAGAVLSCSAAKVAPLPDSNGGGGSGGGIGAPGAGGAAGPSIMPPTIMPAVPPCPNNRCTDFPATPIVDAETPDNAASMFGGAAAGAGPCVWEPQDRAMFPQKWLRPRIRWTGTTGLHRITIHSDMQASDLVVYTSKNAWTMPKDIWEKLATHVVEKDITITVRAAAGGESVVKFQVAAVSATGSMVFWAVKPAEVGRGLTGPNDTYASELRGFAIGDEKTVSVLKTTQVMQQSADEAGTKRKVRCIGCHAAPPAPDNGFIAFVDDWPWNMAFAGVKPGTEGQPLPNMSAGGQAAVNMPWGGMMAFSKPHWNPGKRIVVLASSLQDYMRPWTTDARMKAKLVWYNLDAAAPEPIPGAPTAPGTLTPGVQFGEVMRQGDPNGAGAPTWSYDGTTIIYSSTAGGNSDGALQVGATDLYKVPFNDGAGGPASKVEGAADPMFEEYYAAYAPDDKLVAFTRVPRGQRMYANKLAELAVVPAAGGTALRLDANDPPACTGRMSPGVNNHWAKWSPTVNSSGGKKYYWLLFSSNRTDLPAVPRVYPDPANTGANTIQISQLYMTLVTSDGGKLQSYPALYLWNQPTDTLNTTPIWEDIVIPPVEID
jgi:hypothetical protein